MLGGEAKAASAAMAGVTTVKLGSSVSLSFAGAAPLPRNVGVAFAVLAGLAGRVGGVAAVGGEEARRLSRTSRSGGSRQTRRYEARRGEPLSSTSSTGDARRL